jgi:hypothetical protein
MQRAASKYLRASQLEEIGDLTKEMMFNKYDDMKSQTIKNNGKGQNNFFCQSCGTSYAKWQGSVTLVKNGTL